VPPVHRWFSTAVDNAVSYRRVIIPIVETPVDNSGTVVWRTMWRTAFPVDEGLQAS